MASDLLLVTLPIFSEALAKLAALAPAEGAQADELILKLRSVFPEAEPRVISLAVETFLGRRSAPTKLGGWAKGGFFSTSLLEQSSREAIAKHRAQFFKGLAHVLEIGTGTGSDTAALARVSRHVTTIDADPVASELARCNLELQGITNVSFVVGNALEVIQTLHTPFDGLFADPARRTTRGQRIKSGEDYSPPLSSLLALNIGTLRAIKVSPGLFVEPPPNGWARQFLGFQGECLEQTLWLGAPIADSSVVLTDQNALWQPPHEALPAHYLSEITEELCGYVIEAHGAINRSQKVQQFFTENNTIMIAPDVAYGIAPQQLATSPLLRSYPIIKALPFNTKRLKKELNALGWSNRTELKKRNFMGDLEAVRSDLKLPPHSHGAPFGVLFFFRKGKSPWVIIAEQYRGHQ